MTNLIANTIETALNDVAKHEVTIRRSEESLSADIANDILAVVGERDLVTELDRVKAAACGLALAQALVDGVGNLFGKADTPVPRHVIASFLEVPSNVDSLRKLALQKYMQRVEADVLKRVRIRNEKDVVLERKNTEPRNTTAYGHIPPAVTTSGPMAEPVPAKQHPVLPGEQYHRENTKHDGGLSGPVVGGGRYPAPKGKR